MSINYQELVPEKALGTEISRHIFQTYRAKTGLPHEIELNIKHLKRLNPEYQYHLFDDDDIKAFILEHYGEVIWGYYLRIAPIYGAARADFFRYLLVYQMGGVYLDIKSSMDKPLKEVLCREDKFVLTHWDNRLGEQYEGIGIYTELGALPRGEEYTPFCHGAGLWGVLRTTGPIMYTKVIEAMRPTLIEGQDYRMLDRPQEIGLRYSIFDTAGVYGHKKVLKANYNKEYTPIIVTPDRPLYAKCAKYYLFVRLAIRVLGDKIAARFK